MTTKEYNNKLKKYLDIYEKAMSKGKGLSEMRFYITYYLPKEGSKRRSPTWDIVYVNSRKSLEELKVLMANEYKYIRNVSSNFSYTSGNYTGHTYVNYTNMNTHVYDNHCKNL